VARALSTQNFREIPDLLVVLFAQARKSAQNGLVLVFISCVLKTPEKNE
jgi:hypothetical protein